MTLTWQAFVQAARTFIKLEESLNLLLFFQEDFHIQMS